MGLISKASLIRVLARLQLAQNFASNPLLLSVVLLSVEVHDFRSEVYKVFEECVITESAMGYAEEDDEITLGQQANLTETSRRLNVLSSYVANVQYDCSSLCRVFDELRSQLDQLSDEHCPNISTELREQIVYFQEVVTSGGILSKRVDKIVQSMVQTVRDGLTTLLNGSSLGL